MRVVDIERATAVGASRLECGGFDRNAAGDCGGPGVEKDQLVAVAQGVDDLAGNRFKERRIGGRAEPDPAQRLQGGNLEDGGRAIFVGSEAAIQIRRQPRDIGAAGVFNGPH